MNKVLAELGEFFFMPNPIRVKIIGGPISISTKKKTKPFKFPTSNAIIS